MPVNNPNQGIAIPFSTTAQAQAGVSQNTVISPFTLKAVVQPIQDTIDAIQGINDLQAFASEVNLIESSVGLQPDGSFVAPVGTSYLGSITTIKGGLTQLDTQLSTTASNLSSEITNRIADVNAEETRALAAESALQTELNTTQTGAGLNANGTYTAPVGSNYLGSATSLKSADVHLDTQIKQVRDQVDAILLASDADKDSFAEIVSLINSIDTQNDTAFATFATNVNQSMGSAINGVKDHYTSTNYVLANDTYNEAVNKIDAKLLDLQTQVTTIETTNNTALQSELDTTQTGAGLGTDGAYIPNPSAVYIDDAVSLRDADNKLDAQLFTVTSDLGSLEVQVDGIQTELDNTQAGAGLGANGAYTANAGSNYLTAAITLKDADNKLDARIKINSDDIVTLDGRVDQHDSDISGIATELNNIETAVGLADNGTKTNFSSSNVITANSSFKSAIEALDSYVGTMEGGNGVIALQSELDATQTGAGLETTGVYVAPIGSNYLGSTTSLKNALTALDTQMVNRANDIAGLTTEINNAETALGLEANGTKTDFGSTNVVVGNSSYKTAIEALDTYIGNMEGGNGTIALQDEVDRIETAVGLNTNGTYSAHSGTTYLDNATSVKNALTLIDTELATIKDKSLYRNSYYVNDGVNDIQTVIDSVAGGGSAYAIYVGAGSYGGSTVTISNAPSGMLINGPMNPTGVHRCEWLSRGLTISGATTTRVVICNINIEGAVTINGTAGRHLFKNVIFDSTVTINNSCANFITFEDCSFAGGITITSNVTAAVTFTRCAMGNQLVTSQRAGAGSPLLTIMAECSGLNASQTNLTSNVALVGRTGYFNQTVYQFQNADVYVYDLVNGLSTSFSGSYTELRNKPTIPTAYTDEEARDAAGTALANGTHTGISFTNDDGNNKINAVVSLASFTTNDLTQGATNKYYTAATAKADLIVNNTNGDEEDQAPSVHAIKGYVDAKFEQAVQGLDFHDACKTASNGSNVNIASGPASIGGYSFTASGERVLLKDQTDAKQNGIYDWNGLGSAMTRSADSNDDPDGEVTGGMLTFIQEGDLAGTSWVLTAPEGSVTLGVDNLTFVQFSGGGVTYSGGNGITVSGTSISLDLNELTTETSLAASDKFAFADASDSGAPKNTTLTSLANKLAGSGLSASSGVLAVDASNNVTITGTQTISGDKTFSGTTTISGSIGLGSTATATTQASTDNSTKVATTAYVTTAVENVITAQGANGAVIIRGDFDATSGTPSLATAKKGDLYNVAVAGTYLGIEFAVTDQILFIQDVVGGTVTTDDFVKIDNTEGTLAAGGIALVNLANGVSRTLTFGNYFIYSGASNATLTLPQAKGTPAGVVLYLRHTGTGTLSVIGPTFSGSPNSTGSYGTKITYNNTASQRTLTLTAAGEYKFFVTGSRSIVVAAPLGVPQYDYEITVDCTVTNKTALRTTDDLTEGSTNKYASAANVRAHLSATAPIVYTQATGVISTTLTQYTDELAQDAINTALTNGTHSGISYSYNDGSNALSSTVAITGAALTWPTTALSTGTTAGAVGSYYYTSTTLQGSAYTVTPPGSGNNGDVLYIHNLGGNTINFGTTAYYYNGSYSGTGQTFTSTENDVFVFTRLGTGNAWLISKQASHNRYANEDAVDAVGAALVAGNASHTGIQFTYGATQDSANRIDAAVSLSGFSTTNLSEGDNLYYTQERVEDAINTLLTSGTRTGITYTYTDNGTGAGSLDSVVSLSGFSIDALSDVDTSTTAPTDGQSLTWNSSSSKWVPSTVSGGGGGGGISVNAGPHNITTSTTVTANSDENYFIVRGNAAAITVTLPVPSSSNMGRKIIIKSLTEYAVTIQRNGATGTFIWYDGGTVGSGGGLGSTSFTHPANASGFSSTLICLEIESGTYGWVLV
jgi:hypothetical protein